MSEPASQLLTPDEIRDLTGCVLPAVQLKHLQRRGFWLAWRNPRSGNVVLPRAHFLAVCAGARQAEPAAADAPPARPAVQIVEWSPRQRAAA